MLQNTTRFLKEFARSLQEPGKVCQKSVLNLTEVFAEVFTNLVRNLKIIGKECSKFLKLVVEKSVGHVECV